jgi:beta-mannosidase
MKTNIYSLNGDWELRFGPQEKRACEMVQPEIPSNWIPIPAVVPGNVEMDLIRAGLLVEDLARGNNIYLLRKFEKYQWWYCRKLELRERAPGRTMLEFNGVDTLATVWINGHKIGVMENMLIPHRFDVTEVLKPGDNMIVIGIDSPVLAAQGQPIDACEWAMENNWESLSIRKAAHTFGWDIMPRAVSAGLWRDVSLVQFPSNLFRDVYIATVAVSEEKQVADIWVKWHLAIEDWPEGEYSIEIGIFSADDRTMVYSQAFPVLCTHGCQNISLKNISLWWPRGYGKASLYNIKLTLLDAAHSVTAVWDGRVGFRTVQLKRTEITNADRSGDFAFIVNGRRIFIKGTNWVPLDAFHSRDGEHLEKTLDMVVDLNCNMVRCWGGSVYEDHGFFNRCDEEGILVWQDFALACALYPQTEEFFKKIEKEAEAIIPRLRNHPSLALWAGNNEGDLFYVMNRPGSDPNICDRISREVLPRMCDRLDPWRVYLPSSPYYGPELMKAGAPHDMRPEDHLWGPRNDFKGEYYKTSNAHFVSEIGYHGCPGRSSIEKMMNKENLWPWDNQEWYTHATRPQIRSDQFNYRIPLMANQTKYLFGEIPDNLDEFILASQISQAEANKFFIEQFRMGKNVRGGILWWNVRDGWPQFSDSVVDYYGEAKLAYFVIRRIQQDVCVMLAEETEGFHQIIAVNDTLASQAMTVKISLNGEACFESEVSIPINGREILGKVPCSAECACYSIEWMMHETKYRNHYVSGPRPYDLQRCLGFYQKEEIGGKNHNNRESL